MQPIIYTTVGKLKGNQPHNLNSVIITSKSQYPSIKCGGFCLSFECLVAYFIKKVMKKTLISGLYVWTLLSKTRSTKYKNFVSVKRYCIDITTEISYSVGLTWHFSDVTCTKPCHHLTRFEVFYFIFTPTLYLIPNQFIHKRADAISFINCKTASCGNIYKYTRLQSCKHDL